ncbi:MAG: RNA 2'-phosphotransferase [Microscillaceae bacterium]|jgi:putative RNA 2'-phosphotransferase|nr:RNA 2'-phosphotransferase [Microscillaceae bacterium]
MDKKKIKHISKGMSLVLRHKPEHIGITLDEQGWVEVDVLIEAFSKHFFAINRDELTTVVAENDKKRFALSDDGKKIRASQGHSIEIELGYEAKNPPEVLYHGTATKFLATIKVEGLTKQSRHHVHLSSDEKTAQQVGARHGKPVVLRVDAQRMNAQGLAFFQSENGVWLTEYVPVAYLIFPDNYSEVDNEN